MIVQGATTRELSEAEVAAYDAPFPDERFKEGARIFPTLVPASPVDPASYHNQLAWQALRRFTKPVLTAFSDCDPITRGTPGGAAVARLTPSCCCCCTADPSCCCCQCVSLGTPLFVNPRPFAACKLSQRCLISCVMRMVVGARAGGEAPFLEFVPGTRGQRHVTIEGGGHFLQEDKGVELATAVIEFIKANPASAPAPPSKL